MHKNKKIILLGIMVLAAALVLSGCKSAEEKAAEKLIESGTNGQADVDIGTNSVKINTNAGSYQAGGNVTLPSGFPDDVYRISGTLTAAFATTDTEGYTISIETSKSMAEAKNLYDQELVSDGWTVTSSMALQDTIVVTATKDNRFVSVTISTIDSQVTVTITTYTNTSDDADQE